MCVVNIKHDIGDSQNITKYLFVTAGIQNSNNYMFRPFLVAVMYNMPTSWHIVHNLEAMNIQPDDGY